MVSDRIKMRHIMRQHMADAVLLKTWHFSPLSYVPDSVWLERPGPITIILAQSF